MLRSLSLSATALGLALVASACSMSNAPMEPANNVQQSEYKLGPGDAVRVTVYGEDQLSGEFKISDTGSLAMPLVGEIDAKNATLRQLEGRIANKLAQGYVKDARVSAEVTAARPFFIIGEVNAPGQYPYVNGMTAMNAVAVAGGFTYRAEDDEILVTRGSDPEKVEYAAPITTRVYPDDVIRIPERLF